MTIIWTAAAIEQVLADSDCGIAPTREIQYQGITMMVTPVEDGLGRVERIISPRPQDFLRPDCQPGAKVPLHP